MEDRINNLPSQEDIRTNRSGRRGYSWLFTCCICDDTYPFIDGQVYTAPRIELVWIENEQVHRRTLTEAHRPLFCWKCQNQEEDGQITAVDKQGCRVVASLFGE